LARVQINFIGPWRLFLGTSGASAELDNIDVAHEYIEANFNPAYEKKLKSMGIKKMQSVWDNSNIFLNGTDIRKLPDAKFKDGDKLDLLPKVAGG
jgi:molybdopterin converting factor small subunit